MDSEREAPKTPCTSGALSKPTLLGFHSVHGDSIWVSKDRSLARRAQSSDNAITFSNRHVVVGEKVCLRIVEISEEWDGFLNIGFTSHNPDTLANALPKRACPDLSGRPGNWARILEAMFFKPDDILHYYVNSSGDVHFGINGEDKGLLFSGVNTSRQLWAIVDVYGNCTGVQFTNPIQIRRPNALEDRPVANIPTLSVEETLPSIKQRSNVKYEDNDVAFRSTVPSDAQLEILLSRMEERPDLATGHARTAEERARAQRDWEELSAKLNSDKSGCYRTVDQWRKHWRDKKSAVREKVAPLNPTETKIFYIIGGKEPAANEVQPQNESLLDSDLPSAQLATEVYNNTATPESENILQDPQPGPSWLQDTPRLNEPEIELIEPISPPVPPPAVHRSRTPVTPRSRPRHRVGVGGARQRVVQRPPPSRRMLYDIIARTMQDLCAAIAEDSNN